jgi:hypothetical protein
MEAVGRHAVVVGLDAAGIEPIAFCSLPFAPCLLLLAFCSLPFAPCLLLLAFCLSVFCLATHWKTRWNGLVLNSLLIAFFNCAGCSFEGNAYRRWGNASLAVRPIVGGFGFALCWTIDTFEAEHVMSKPKPHAPDAKVKGAEPLAESVDSRRLDEALEESFPASDPIAVDVTDPHHLPAAHSREGGKKRH